MTCSQAARWGDRNSAPVPRPFAVGVKKSSARCASLTSPSLPNPRASLLSTGLSSARTRAHSLFLRGPQPQGPLPHPRPASHRTRRHERGEASRRDHPDCPWLAAARCHRARGPKQPSRGHGGQPLERRSSAHQRYPSRWLPARSSLNHAAIGYLSADAHLLPVLASIQASGTPCQPNHVGMWIALAIQGRTGYCPAVLLVRRGWRVPE